MKINLLCITAVMMLGVACSNNANPAPSNGCPEGVEPSIRISCGGKNFCIAGCVEDYTAICGNQKVISVGAGCSCSVTQGNEQTGKYCAL